MKHTTRRSWRKTGTPGLSAADRQSLDREIIAMAPVDIEVLHQQIKAIAAALGHGLPAHLDAIADHVRADLA